jgi:hypothetical protein
MLSRGVGLVLGVPARSVASQVSKTTHGYRISAAMAAPIGGKGAAAARPAALVWFRSDLRVTDHEPLFRAAADLQSAQSLEQHGALLLPFFCLDSRELAPRAGEVAAGGGTVLRIPQLGPHRLRCAEYSCV